MSEPRELTRVEVLNGLRIDPTSSPQLRFEFEENLLWTLHLREQEIENYKDALNAKGEASRELDYALFTEEELHSQAGLPDQLVKIHSLRAERDEFARAIIERCWVHDGRPTEDEVEIFLCRYCLEYKGHKHLPDCIVLKAEKLKVEWNDI